MTISTIERSIDGIEFDAIGEIKGAGNSSSELKYEFVDENPLPGINYYRIKQTDGLLVISYTTMPAVLIELGFLTTANEEDFLQGDEGQDYMASAIYRAIKEYKSTVEGVPVQQAEEARPDSTRVPVKEPEPVQVKDNGVRFKVQIATSTKRIETKPRNFNGLDGVEEHKGEGLYKYTVGDWPTLEGARVMQRQCKEKGFDGAFIVAFKDGARIDLQKAVTLAEGR